MSSHRTAFERQIREAVLIDEYSGMNLLNSKIEYSRCCIPKLHLKIGNKEEIEDPLKTKEKGIIEKLKMKYKGENKRQVIETDGRPAKKKKIRKVENAETGENEDQNWTENSQNPPEVQVPLEDSRSTPKTPDNTPDLDISTSGTSQVLRKPDIGPRGGGP